MNNNLNINNKPLKCVITNNEAAIKYFSSVGSSKEPYAGTLIIVDKSNGASEPNGLKKIYLNEKFLAGGYGFRLEDYVGKLEKIADEYYQTIDEIHNTEITNINNAWEGINKKLDKSGPYADASNVYFIYNDTKSNHKLYISDIIELLSKAPQYKDLEITSIKLKANYIGYTNDSRDETEEVDYENIEDFTLPINTKLLSLIVTLEINTNHSGGIGRLDTYYKNHRSDTNYNISSHTINSNDVDVIHCQFAISFLQSDPYIIGEENKIIDKFIFNNVLATPESKYQSVHLSNGDDIMYIANTIPSHQKIVEIPYIKGDYYITYSYTTNNIINESSENELNFNNTNLLGIKLLKKIVSNNENKNKFTYINLEQGTSKIVLFLPYKFTIRQAYLVKDSDEISITNFLNFFPYNNNNFILNNLRSHLYYIKISNNLKNGYTLKLDIIENQEITYDIMNNTNEEIPEVNKISFVSTLQDYVINSDEIHKYWVNDNNLDINHLNLIFNYNKL